MQPGGNMQQPLRPAVGLGRMPTITQRAPNSAAAHASGAPNNNTASAANAATGTKYRRLPELGCRVRKHMRNIERFICTIPYVFLIILTVVFMWAKADLFNEDYAPYPAGLRESNNDSVPRAFEPVVEAVGLVTMTFCLIVVVICLIRAHATNPGVVIREDFRLEHAFEVKKDRSPRVCKKCDDTFPPPKPDRTHHCSWCRRCVQHMDHHCPWIGNCVGRQNYKFFILLLIYSSIALALFLVDVAYPAYSALTSLSSLGKDFVFMLSWLLALLLAALLWPFTTFHLYLISKNFTTIEFLERRRTKSPTVKFKSSDPYVMLDELMEADQKQKLSEDKFGASLRKVLYHKSPFDRGCFRNWCHQLGPPLFWLLPVRWGMHDVPPFPTSHRHKELTQRYLEYIGASKTGANDAAGCHPGGPRSNNNHVAPPAV